MMPVSSGAAAKKRPHVSQDKGSEERLTIRARKADRRRQQRKHRERSGEYYHSESTAGRRATGRSRHATASSRFPSDRRSANGTPVQAVGRSAAVSTGQ